MAFKIKRSIIKGTAGHRSALKEMQTDVVKAYSGAKQSEVDQKIRSDKAKSAAVGSLADTAKKALGAAAPTKQKGKIVYKDGKKYYQAPDGTLHTGQVEDYEREKAADQEMKKKKKPRPKPPKADKPVKPTDEDMEKYSDLEKYDDDNPTGKAEPPKKKKKSPNKKSAVKSGCGGKSPAKIDIMNKSKKALKAAAKGVGALTDGIVGKSKKRKPYEIKGRKNPKNPNVTHFKF